MPFSGLPPCKGDPELLDLDHHTTLNMGPWVNLGPVLDGLLLCQARVSKTLTHTHRYWDDEATALLITVAVNLAEHWVISSS